MWHRSQDTKTMVRMHQSSTPIEQEWRVYHDLEQCGQQAAGGAPKEGDYGEVGERLSNILIETRPTTIG